jgi:hypothetical protein
VAYSYRVLLLCLQEPEIDKLELALEVRELVFEGMIDEVIQKVKGLHPKFFESNPHLLFRLKQVWFFYIET